MAEWIFGRNVSGEYGYINTETGEFRTTIPNSREEKEQQIQKQNKAILKEHSFRSAKFDRIDSKRRNHNDETIQKTINIPVISMNPDGSFANNYIQALAPYESSMNIVSPEFEILSGIRGGFNLPKPKKASLKTQTSSHLDWSDWLKYNSQADQNDIIALQKHIPEYLEIERTAKVNGTWLKMPDGSTWTGDPRSWVQLMSKDGQKLSRQVWWHGDTNKYINNLGEDVTAIKNGERIMWGSSKPHIARSYTNSDNQVIPIVLKQNHTPLKEINAEGRLWRSAYKKDGNYYDTNTFSIENLKDGEYLIINNVIDRGSSPITKNSKYFIDSLPNESYTDYLIRTQKGNDIIIGNNTPRKYLVGNNGNFDLSNPNVYKVLIPLISTSYGISKQNN